MIYLLISQRLATYKELRDDYTMDEAIDLYEICLVSLYNKNEMANEIKEKNKKRNKLK